MVGPLCVPVLTAPMASRLGPLFLSFPCPLVPPSGGASPFSPRCACWHFSASLWSFVVCLSVVWGPWVGSGPLRWSGGQGTLSLLGLGFFVGGPGSSVCVCLSVVVSGVAAGCWVLLACGPPWRLGALSGSVHMFNSSRPRGRSGERAKRAQGQKIDQGGVQGGAKRAQGKKIGNSPNSACTMGFSRLIRPVSV